MIVLHKAIRTDGQGEVKGFLTKIQGKYNIISDDNENTVYPILEHTIEPCNIDFWQTEEVKKLNIEIKLLQSENEILINENETLKSANLIYNKFANELLDKMLKEIEKDGWCRLVAKEEDILKYKARLNL